MSTALVVATQPQANAERRWGAALAAPAMLLIVALMLGPIVVLIALSVTDYRLGAVAVQFLGARNYEAMLVDPVVQRSLANTLLYVALVLPASVFGALLIAILIHARARTRSVYEVIYFLPVTSTLVAMATVWQFMLHPNLGALAPLATALGLSRPDFLNDPDLAIWAVALIGIWQLVGFNMVLFLAGLSIIPKELYEAAAVDGSDGAIDRFRTVTWPMLGPTTMFVTITSTVTAFKAFDTILVLTRGGPLGTTETVLYVLYLEGFHYFRTGYAAALTVSLLVFLILLSLAQAFAFDRKVHYQ